MKHRKILCAASASLIAVAAHSAIAQDASVFDDRPVATVQDPTIEEIVVTGSRLRLESAQETPIAVTSLSAQALEKLNGTNLTALSSVVPNLLVSTVPSNPGLPALTLRGFLSRTSNISVEPGVPVYIDGVFQTLNTGSLGDLYDLDRAEVLRGPQGTLLGKNASAGAVLLTRSRPTGELGFRGQVEYGSYNLVQVQALGNTPIVNDILSAKLYASFRSRDSWVDNYFVPGGDLGGEERGSVRGAILFTPNSDITLYLTADYLWDRSQQAGGRNVSRDSSLGCVLRQICGPDIGDRHVTGANFLTKPKTDEHNITSNLDWKIGGAKLTSITGYKTYKQDNYVDLDVSSADIFHVHEITDSKQFSQELRLSSVENAGLDLDGRLTWLVAAYYGRANATGIQTLIPLGSATTRAQKSIRTTTALYGHLDYEVTDGLVISGGARRSWDKVVHSYAFPIAGPIAPALTHEESAKFRNSSFEAGLQYKFSDSKMIYVRYAEGYRGGGFIGFPGNPAAVALFRPETSESYEAGLKSEWLDRKLQFNLTLFDVKFKDLQRNNLTPGPGNTFVQIISNVADATTKGVEIETILKPIDAVRVGANIGYLDAKYTDYLVTGAGGVTVDRSGEPLIYAPKWTVSLSADADIPLSSNRGWLSVLNLHAQYNYRSTFEMGYDLDPVGHQDGYGTLDLSATLSGGVDSPLSVTAYVQNLFDKAFIAYGENVSDIMQTVVDDIGRTAGMRIAVKF